MADRRRKRTTKAVSNAALYHLMESTSDSVQSLQSHVIKLDKKLDLHIQQTQFGFEKVATEDKRQNDLLEEHHNRSVQLKRDNDLKEQSLRQEIEDKEKASKERDLTIESRVSILEAPGKWLRSTWFIFLAGGAGAAALLKIMELFGK